MIFKTIIKAFRPFRLVSLVITYLLGAGLVQLVREINSWAVFFLGIIFLLLIYLSLDLMWLLHAAVDPRYWLDGMTTRKSRQVRLITATIIATLLTVATTVFIGWMQTGILWQGLVFLLAAMLVVAGFYYVSRVIEKFRTLQLLVEALLFVVIPPAVAYFLQSDTIHPLLTMVVIPLVPGYLACRMLSLLVRFGRDHKYDLQTLVTQIGWERAMFFHNALILLTYLLYALIALLGFPWFLIWPVFLTLPIGLVEIWLMERVRRGMKPLWGVMRFAAACVLFIPIYLVGVAFWIR